MRVLIDTDPAIGIPFKDIDDGLAILFLLASPEVSIEGLTINFGNVSLNRGYQAAKGVLKIAKVDLSVFRGARSKNDLGKHNSAVDFLIKTVNKYPKEITLLAIAPLTNVASAMMLDDKFAYNLRNLVIMGGSIDFKPFCYFGEFNFHQDGRAAAIVMSSPIPKALITMDVCSQAIFTGEHLKKIKNRKSAVAKYLSKTIPSWQNINKLVTTKGGFHPWDVVAAAYLVNNSLFDKNPYTFAIQERGIKSGRIYNFIRQDSFSLKNNIMPINVPLHLNADKFMNLFISRLLKS